MKIGILGTRGIPNHYGGFEQFAEFLSGFLLEKGCEVTVYSPHNHPYQANSFKGVEIIHKYDPESVIGTAGQFVYDFNCIIDSRKRGFDIILQLGYTSSAVFFDLHSSRSKVITNMDGLEWKRSKYSAKIQRFLKWSEKLAISKSDALVADSIGIQKHILDGYSSESTYIPYGADLFSEPDNNILKKYQVEEYNYDILIARIEPENHVGEIVKAHVKSNVHRKLLIVGSTQTPLGKKLYSKYKTATNIEFLGGVYDMASLNNLRYYSNLYFHGHSVGGTNPSLLEAMGSDAFIVAHDNIFNKTILEEDACYFCTEKELIDVIESKLKTDNKELVKNNRLKIKEIYNWQKITEQYHALFLSV